MLNEDDLRPGDVIQDAMGDFWHVHDDGKIWCSEPGSRTSFETANGACGPFTYPLGYNSKQNKDCDSEDDSVKHEGKWTRDDLPSVIKWNSYAGMHLSRLRELEEYVDVMLDHLNAHYPKPQPYDQGGVRGADSLLYRAERERDAAVARADNLDKQLAKVMSDYQDVEDERDEWKARAGQGGQWTRDDFPASLPDAEGVYGPSILVPSVRRDLAAWLNAHHPKPELSAMDYAEIVAFEAARATRAEQKCDELRSLIEGQKEHVTKAQRERDRWKAATKRALEHRDEWKGRADQLRDERDEWKARAEQMEKNLAKVMSDYQDVEDERDAAVARAEAHAKGATRSNLDRDTAYEELTAMTIRAEAAERDRDYARARLREVCSTPAVHVVRESDLPAARVDGDDYLVEDPKGDYRWPKHGASWWEDRAQDALTKAARFTALARLSAASEADPVEAKARAEADRRYSGDPNHAFIEGALWANRHLNEQEGEQG